MIGADDTIGPCVYGKLLLSLGGNGNGAVDDDLNSLAGLQVLLDLNCGHHALDLLHFQLVLLCQVFILGSNVFFGNGDVLNFHDLSQGHIDLGLLLSSGTESIAHGVHVAAHHLGVLLNGVAAHLQLISEALHLAVQLGFDQCLGHIDGCVLSSLFNAGVLKSRLSLLLGILLSLSTDVSLQLVQRIELGNVLSKLVVLLGRDGDGDLIQLDMEDNSLASQFGMIVFGESDRIAIAAAVPTAWPHTAHVPITRVEANAL